MFLTQKQEGLPPCAAALRGLCLVLRGRRGCRLRLSVQAACWSRPLGEAATWRRLAGKGLVSCVRRRQLLTQLWTVPGVKEVWGRRSGPPVEGAASWVPSGRPSGLESAPSGFCSLGPPWLPLLTSLAPSLKAKVRKDGAVCGPPHWVLEGNAGA